VQSPVAVEKLTLYKFAENLIALGCPVNDVLDFGEHFLSLDRDSFFKRGGFSTATPGYNSYPLRVA
jgi:hypothetical protein